MTTAMEAATFLARLGCLSFLLGAGWLVVDSLRPRRRVGGENT